MMAEPYTGGMVNWLREAEAAGLTDKEFRHAYWLAARLTPPKKKGRGWYSVQQLADDAGGSASTAKRTFKKLQRAELLEQTRRGHRLDADRNAASEWQLMTPRRVGQVVDDPQAQGVTGDTLESTQGVTSERQGVTGGPPRGVSPHVGSSTTRGEQEAPTPLRSVDAVSSPSSTTSLREGPTAVGRTIEEDQKEAVKNHVQCDCEIAETINSLYGRWAKINGQYNGSRRHREQILDLFGLDEFYGHEDAEERVPVLTAVTRMLDRGDDLIKVAKFVHAKVCPRRTTP